MDKNTKVEVGTEVLIFNYDKKIYIKDETFIKGIVKSVDINNYTNNYNQFCCVVDYNGNEYNGLYGYNEYGNIYFITMEDYIHHLKLKIYRNVKKIKQLEKQGIESKKIIDWLKKENSRIFDIIIVNNAVSNKKTNQKKLIKENKLY